MDSLSHDLTLSDSEVISNILEAVQVSTDTDVKTGENPKDPLSITWVSLYMTPCQQQTNAVDCGVFTVANAMALLCGGCLPVKRDPGTLRAHFINVITKGLEHSKDC